MRVLFFSLLINCNVYAQECSCAKVANVVISTMEKEYGVFKIDKNYVHSKAYKKAKSTLLANALNGLKICDVYINNYVKSFDDLHLNYYNFDSIALSKFTTSHLTEYDEKHLNKIEGIWQFSEFPTYYKLSRYKNTVLGKPLYDFGDVDTTDTWQQLAIYNSLTPNKYDIVLKIKNAYPNIYSCYLFGNKLIDIASERTILTKVDSVHKFKFKYNAPNGYLEFKRINTRYNYLAIKDLSEITKTEVDSLLNKHDSIIRKTETLILGFRDNPGGSTASMKGLIKYIADKPFKFSNTYYHANDSLISAVEKNCNQSTNDTTSYCDSYLKNLRMHRGGIYYDTVQPNFEKQIYITPRNVYILINRKSYSAAEMIVREFKQSSKVVLFGEPSGGAIDTGNALPYQICNGILYIPSEFSDFILTNKEGKHKLVPNVLLKGSEDTWLEQVVQYRTP
jgi:hypothetical protein